MDMNIIYLISGIAVSVLLLIVGFLRRYKVCPSNKLLIVFGKVSKGTEGNNVAKIVTGATFVWPIIQKYDWLRLEPISFEVNLDNALSNQSIRVSIPSRFTIAVSGETGVAQNAAQRLLGLSDADIEAQAKDIILGQLRAVVATLTIEEINSDRDSFLAKVENQVGDELKKIGIKLINVNVTDITDESGYIEALGKEAASKAINDAKVKVAENDRSGSIGEAEQKQLQRTKVASANSKAEIGESEAEKEQRVKTAQFNATAVEGENQSQVSIANSDASRNVAQAEAKKKSTAADLVNDADAKSEGYIAEAKSEKERGLMRKEKLHAEEVVPQEIAKEKVIIDAEAEAGRLEKIAGGEAKAIFLKAEAEAKGQYEILAKNAEGFKELVDAAGGDPTKAIQFLLADKAESLLEIQVGAIKNIDFDKIVVWDNGGNGDGNGGTKNFINDMMTALPGFQSIFDAAGVEIPGFLQGKALELPAVKETESKVEVEDVKVIEDKKSEDKK